MRNATAYGVSPRLRLDIVLNDLVASAYTNWPGLHQERWHALASHRAHTRHYRRNSRALEAPREAIHNETFNVGRTEENYRIRELADIVAETVPGCRVEYAPGGGPDKRCYRISCDKISRLLPGFRPQWTARKGAQELYDAYRAAGLTLEDIEERPLRPYQPHPAPLESRGVGRSLLGKLPHSGNAFPSDIRDPSCAEIAPGPNSIIS